MLLCCLKLEELYSGDSLEKAGHLVMILKGEDSAMLLNRSPQTEHFGSVYLSMGEGLEMACHMVVIWSRETLQSLVRPSGTEPFKLVELHLADGLEMAGCSIAILLGRDSA